MLKRLQQIKIFNYIEIKVYVYDISIRVINNTFFSVKVKSKNKKNIIRFASFFLVMVKIWFLLAAIAFKVLPKKNYIDNIIGYIV